MSLREIIQGQSRLSKDPFLIDPMSRIASKLILTKASPDVNRPRRLGNVIGVNLVNLRALSFKRHKNRVGGREYMLLGVLESSKDELLGMVAIEKTLGKLGATTADQTIKSFTFHLKLKLI